MSPARRPPPQTLPRATASPSPLDAAAAVAGRIWMTSQHPSRTQRGRRYTPESIAHPAKMLPAIAAHAIATYTEPGELVCDPMCGIGTTLVEAVRAARPALGVEYEPRWAALARANLALAAADGHPAPAQVLTGDARHLTRLIPADRHGQVALVITSPPYGPSLHGRLANPVTEPIRKINHRYGDQTDRANLANLPHPRLLAGFTRILTETTALLRPGGHVVITVRPWRERGELIDLPTQIMSLCRAGRAGGHRTRRGPARPDHRHRRVRGPRLVLPTRLHHQTTPRRATAAPARARGRHPRRQTTPAARERRRSYLRARPAAGSGTPS